MLAKFNYIVTKGRKVILPILNSQDFQIKYTPKNSHIKIELNFFFFGNNDLKICLTFP